MKKSVSIFGVAIAVAALSAFAKYNKTDSQTNGATVAPCKSVYFDYDLVTLANVNEKTEIFYGFGPRFNMTYTKEELKQIKSVTDIRTCNNLDNIVSYTHVSVVVLDHNYNFVKQVNGEDGVFSSEQLEFISSVPYSTDLLIRAEFKQRARLSNELEDSYTTPHITVVPEKQAVYTLGEESLVSYVKTNTENYASQLAKHELRPGKVRFTISTSGKVENVFLESTSGDNSFDEDVMKLITELPGKWIPGENGEGGEC